MLGLSQLFPKDFLTFLSKYRCKNNIHDVIIKIPNSQICWQTSYSFLASCLNITIWNERKVHRNGSNMGNEIKLRKFVKCTCMLLNVNI